MRMNYSDDDEFGRGEGEEIFVEDNFKEFGVKTFGTTISVMLSQSIKTDMVSCDVQEFELLTIKVKIPTILSLALRITGFWRVELKEFGPFHR